MPCSTDGEEWSGSIEILCAGVQVDEEEKVDVIRKRYRQLGRARDLARALCLICVRMLCSSGNDKRVH